MSKCTDTEKAKMLESVLVGSERIIAYRSSLVTPENIKANCGCDPDVGYQCEWCAENEVFQRLQRISELIK